MEKPDPKAVLKLALSSLDDDLHDMTDEEVKQELAEAGVDLAESERRWMQLERDSLARLRGEKRSSMEKTFFFYWHDENDTEGRALFDTFKAVSFEDAEAAFRKEHPSVKGAWVRECVGQARWVAG